MSSPLMGQAGWSLFSAAPDTVTYLRSSAKPFQAIPLVASGAADRFGFTEKEIALACASHSGEPMHTETGAVDAEKDWARARGFEVRHA